MKSIISASLFATAQAKKQKPWTPLTSSVQAMQDIEYFMEGYKDSLQFMGMFQGKAACNVCTEALGPIDFLLTNPTIRVGLDFVATEICVNLGIEGGKRSVCKGGV